MSWGEAKGEYGFVFVFASEPQAFGAFEPPYGAALEYSFLQLCLLRLRSASPFEA